MNVYLIKWAIHFPSFRKRPEILQHIMSHNLVEIKTKTVTSIFVRMMIKCHLLPISINREKNCYQFNFWSNATLIHILLFCTPTGFAASLYWCALYQSGILSNFMENSSFAEKFSSFGTCLIFLQVYLILPLAKQLKSFPSHLVVQDQMKFPKYGNWNILAFITMSFGCVSFNIGLLGKHGKETNDRAHLTAFSSNLFMVLSQSLYWCLFSIIIQVWLENIIRVRSKDVIKDSKMFIRNYKMFTSALENYYFYCFAIFQIFSITTLFLACSKIILQVTKY